MIDLINDYKTKLNEQLNSFDWQPVEQLAQLLMNAAKTGSNVFICGNGGSAGNAMHLANDFIYGVDPSGKSALNVEALTANSSVITCLGNDIGYENIFSHQLKVKGKADDILIVLSGSGNSSNIINALTVAKEIGIKSAAILGYQGGKALNICDTPIHFAINDMQIAEDLQIIVGHMLMQHLARELS